MADTTEARDPLLEALTHAIHAQLTGPAPTAPVPPQQMGLPPLKAAAAAMNPQFAPLLLQQQNAPAQAQYAQQQAAFEQAMAGRDRALQAGTTLAAAGVRADASRDVAGMRGTAAAKGQIRVVEGPDGKPALQEFVPDGQGGFTPGKILATGPDTLRFLATPEGYVPVSPRTGTSAGGYVQKPGGGPALPPPPAGTVSDVAASQATISGLDNLKSAWLSLKQKTGGQSFLEQAGKSLVGNTQYGGAFESTRDYAEYAASMRAALNAYIKSVTGAQFSVAELQRYESQFPRPWEDEALVNQKLADLKARAMSDMQAKIRAFPAAGKAGPPATLDDEFDAYQRSRNAPK